MMRRYSVDSISPDDVAGVQRRNLADALFKATTKCLFHRVKFLLDNGVSPLVINDDGLNLLMAALYVADDKKRDAMFQYLIKRGADVCYVERKTGRDVVTWAASLGRPQQVEVALKSAVGEIDLHRTDKQGQTALHHAVIRGHHTVVDILVKHMEKYRLSLDVPDSHGLTPYIYAKKLGYFWIADALADGGCSVNQFDLKHFRSADEWEEHGRQERHKQMQRDLACKKAGLSKKIKHYNSKPQRLPALTITTEANHSVVFSIPASGVQTDRKRKSPILQSRKNSSIGSCCSSAMDARMREDTSLLLSLASTNSIMRHSLNENISSIMQLVAEQCTHTFRKSYRPPTPEKLDPYSSIAYVIKGGKKYKIKDPHSKSGHNISGVMSAFHATKQIVNEQTERKKRKSLVPV